MSHPKVVITEPAGLAEAACRLVGYVPHGKIVILGTRDRIILCAACCDPTRDQVVIAQETFARNGIGEVCIVMFLDAPIEGGLPWRLPIKGAAAVIEGQVHRALDAPDGLYVDMSESVAFRPMDGEVSLELAEVSPVAEDFTAWFARNCSVNSDLADQVAASPGEMSLEQYRELSDLDRPLTVEEIAGLRRLATTEGHVLIAAHLFGGASWKVWQQVVRACRPTDVAVYCLAAVAAWLNRIPSAPGALLRECAPSPLTLLVSDLVAEPPPEI